MKVLKIYNKYIQKWKILIYINQKYVLNLLQKLLKKYTIVKINLYQIGFNKIETKRIKFAGKSFIINDKGEIIEEN